LKVEPFWASARLPRWVKSSKAQNKQLFSGLRRTADTRAFITFSRGTTGRVYFLARLRHDRPDLAELLQMWRKATTGAKHVRADPDNVSIKPEHGNTRAYTLDRLKRERPDLTPPSVRRRAAPSHRFHILFCALLSCSISKLVGMPDLFFDQLNQAIMVAWLSTIAIERTSYQRSR
jgi:hypothetical protein